MTRLRVLQFNMQFGQGWADADPDHAPIRMEDTLAEIRRHDADVIFLQEVERAGPGGGQVHPPPNYTRLREALPGYDSHFAYPKADDRELPFGIGLAIFSRAPLQDRLRVDLPSPPIEFEFRGRRTTPTDRVLIGARAEFGGRELQLFNVHLLAFFMISASSAEYPQQRAQVARLLGSARGPALLAGDFNVRDHASLVREFAARGFATVQQEQVTWRRRPFVLDHIFYNPPLRCVAHQVVPTPASDHHALRADFEIGAD
jgi:endonuclease/exonuclease/phosphatase (EEP) superfamily protein YafD